MSVPSSPPLPNQLLRAPELPYPELPFFLLHDANANFLADILLHARDSRLFFHIAALVQALLKVAQPLEYLVQGPGYLLGFDSHSALHSSA